MPSARDANRLDMMKLVLVGMLYDMVFPIFSSSVDVCKGTTGQHRLVEPLLAQLQCPQLHLQTEHLTKTPVKWLLYSIEERRMLWIRSSWMRS